MRQAVSVVFVLALTGGVVAAEEKPGLRDDKEKRSYSIGYQVGGDMKRQAVEVDAEALFRGVKDGLSGAEPLVTQDEMREILTGLKRAIVAAEREKQKEAAKENLEKGKAFLEANAKKEGVVVLPSGLQYQALQSGQGQSPGPSDTVTVHYRGTLLDATEFDSSHRRGKPATLRLDRVIKGWSEGLQLMQPGARYRLFIPPHLAYGERAVGSTIGPNSTLIFDVELISVGPGQ